MKRIICIAFSLLFIVPSLCFKCAATSAKAAVLINGDTGEVLYSKNENMRLPMASTTKIMTALILCKSGRLDRITTVTRDAVLTEGTSMGLRAGDSVTFRDLLYGMMLPSGNDAANAAAISLGGSIKDFAVIMNSRAKSLNLKNTHFVTPSGLDADGHYTTVLDLANLARAAMQNPDFAEAVSKEKITLSYGGSEHTLINHHRMVRNDDDVIGVKTGFTKAAGRCLVTAAKRDGRYLIAVTLNDRNDWNDHRQLLDYGYSQLKTPYKSETTVKYIPISSGGLAVCKIPDFEVYANNTEKLKVQIVLPPLLFSPIKENDRIGNMYCYFETRLIKTVPLKADRIIKQKEMNKAASFKQLLIMLISAAKG